MERLAGMEIGQRRRRREGQVRIANRSRRSRVGQEQDGGWMWGATGV